MVDGVDGCWSTVDDGDGRWLVVLGINSDGGWVASELRKGVGMEWLSKFDEKVGLQLCLVEDDGFCVRWGRWL